MLASGIGIGLGVDLGKCDPELGELSMTIANRGTCQPWHDLAYLLRGTREPNAPSRTKSRQLTCHLPDEVDVGLKNYGKLCRNIPCIGLIEGCAARLNVRHVAKPHPYVVPVNQSSRQVHQN